MAPTPKKKHSHQRTRERRGKITVDLPNLTTCKSCGKDKFAHKLCPHCGAR